MVGPHTFYAMPARMLKSASALSSTWSRRAGMGNGCTSRAPSWRNWDKKGTDNELFLKAYAWDGQVLTERLAINFTKEKLGRPLIMRGPGLSREEGRVHDAPLPAATEAREEPQRPACCPSSLPLASGPCCSPACMARRGCNNRDVCRPIQGSDVSKHIGEPSHHHASPPRPGDRHSLRGTLITPRAIRPLRANPCSNMTLTSG